MESRFGTVFGVGRFGGKVVLVSGAGQGIGRAIAQRFAAEGAAIGILERNPETAGETDRMLRDQGARTIVLIADVADAGQVAQRVAEFLDRFGRIDVLVNNAGFDRPGALLKLNPDDFRAVWDVHVLGAVNCCQSCVPAMMARGDGRIVNVSSIYGKVGSKGEAAYSSAKAGLIGLTRSMSREWGSRGIRVNAVLPGLTETPTIRDAMSQKFKDAIIAETALGRAADPAEIAAVIAFLASDEASFITGATLDVSGGWCIG